MNDNNNEDETMNFRKTYNKFQRSKSICPASREHVFESYQHTRVKRICIHCGLENGRYYSPSTYSHIGKRFEGKQDVNNNEMKFEVYLDVEK